MGFTQRPSAVRGMVFIVMVITVVGCTANLPFRTNFDSAGGDPKKAVIETTAAYRLGFVEFDDQGYFWDLRQRDAVEEMIRQDAGLDAGVGGSPGATPKGVVLVAFVHGWKDNASYDGDGSVACRQILTELSQAEQLQTDHPPRPVIGVYAGWRGLSATWEPFKELSFWDRKDTAHKVGGYGALTRLLIDLENLQKQSLDVLPKDQPRTELVVIGHTSFASTQPAAGTAASRPGTREHAERLRRSIDNVKAQRHRWEPNATKPKDYPFDGSVLRPVDGYRAGDPFLIVSVDPQIMADHNDITNPNLIRFVREYIQFSRLDSTDHTN